MPIDITTREGEQTARLSTDPRVVRAISETHQALLNAYAKRFSPKPLGFGGWVKLFLMLPLSRWERPTEDEIARSKRQKKATLYLICVLDEFKENGRNNRSGLVSSRKAAESLQGGDFDLELFTLIWNQVAAYNAFQSDALYENLPIIDRW